MLPLLHGLDGLGWQRLDSHRVELVVPQVLDRHGVVVLDIEPRHFLHFVVDARVLPLHVGVVVAVLELAQRLLWLDGWCARLNEECLMSVYLSRRG